MIKRPTPPVIQDDPGEFEDNYDSYEGDDESEDGDEQEESPSYETPSEEEEVAFAPLPQRKKRVPRPEAVAPEQPARGNTSSMGLTVFFVIFAIMVVGSFLIWFFVLPNLQKQEQEPLPPTLVVNIPHEFSTAVPEEIAVNRGWSSMQQLASRGQWVADLSVSSLFGQGELLGVTTMVALVDDLTLEMLVREELAGDPFNDGIQRLHLQSLLILMSRGLAITIRTDDFRTTDSGSFAWLLLNLSNQETAQSESVRAAQWAQVLPMFNSIGTEFAIWLVLECQVARAVPAGMTVLYPVANFEIPVYINWYSEEGEVAAQDLLQVTAEERWRRFGLRTDIEGETQPLPAQPSVRGLEQTWWFNQFRFSQDRMIQILRTL
jgi:hypothetical protein